MYTTSLRKVGGSVMLAVPPAILDLLHLQAGEEVAMTMEGGRLLIEPQSKPRFTLEELLLQCDASAPLSQEDEAWVAVQPAGLEI
jgi:antitoxin ChpS